MDEQLLLVLAVIGARVGDVVHHFVRVQSEALADLRQTLGAEGALRVDVQRLALAAALLHRQLADDGERVTELRLARPELSVELGEGPRFHSPYVSVGVLVEVPPRIASSSLHPVEM